MKSLLSILITIIGMNSLGQGVQFLDLPYDKVLELAKQQNKPVVIDVYTATCGPCRWMDKNVFSDSALAAFMNDSVISYKLDAGVKSNRSFCREYSINAFPTFLYLAPTGDLVYRTVGAVDAATFKGQILTAIDKSNESKPLAMWDAGFATHASDTAFLFSYIQKRQLAGLPNGKLIEDYLYLLPDNERYTKRNLELVFNNAGTLLPAGKACDVILSCRESLKKWYSEKECDDYIDYVLMGYTMGLINSAAIDTNETQLDYIIKIASEIKSPDLKSPGFDYQIKGTYYSLINDFKRYGDITCEYVHKYLLPGENTIVRDTMQTLIALNMYIDNFFYDVTDPAHLMDALGWAQRGVNMAAANPMLREYFYYDYLDKKANLLYKTGNLGEAFKLKEQILASIPDNANGLAQRSNILDQMEKMKREEVTWNRE